MTSQLRPVPLTVDVLAVGSANSSRGGAAKNVCPAWRLPGAVLGWLRRQGSLSWFRVLLPGLFAAFYFGLITSDVYVAEGQFVVRSAGKPAKSGLGMLLSSVGFANASEEVRAAQGSIQSRNALRDLERYGLARKAWGNDDLRIINRFDSLGISGVSEELCLYYVGEAAAEFDTETGITTLTVRAYFAQDAQVIVNAGRFLGHFGHGVVVQGRG
jgi:capsule polysaccharide export protein KpsE/RkpR